MKIYNLCAAMVVEREKQRYVQVGKLNTGQVDKGAHTITISTRMLVKGMLSVGKSLLLYADLQMSRA